jgi:MYXO-CTERM domain-containing protein
MSRHRAFGRARALAVALALGASVAVGVVATLAPPAAAYVRYETDAGVTFAWPQTCVLITAYPADFVSMMPLDEIQNAINGAAYVWTASADACTYLAITPSFSMLTPPQAVNDHKNSIIFRTTSWCELETDGTCNPTPDPTDPYDAAALAVTSVTANKQTGVIRDADIEINALDHMWADLVAHPELLTTGGSIQDLQNALAHEMGHLIGLDHTCYQPSSGLPRPLDNTGTPIPDCDAAPPDVVATTMFPSATAGDTQKRTLAPDDQQAVCDIYPAARDPMICNPDAGDPSGCNCAAAGAPATTALGAVVLAAIMLLGVRRRRAART